MRKSFLILGLFLAVSFTPRAHADTFADASFTCDSSCIAVPTDPPVSFPSPNIPVNFFNQSFNIILNSFDQSSDNYTWGIGSNNNSWYFIINDLNNGFSDFGPSFLFGNFGIPYGNGHVYFDCNPPTATPEPGSVGLLLLGLVVALAFRKQLRASRLQAF